MLLYHHSFTHTPLFLLDMSGSGNIYIFAPNKLTKSKNIFMLQYCSILYIYIYRKPCYRKPLSLKRKITCPLVLPLFQEQVVKNKVWYLIKFIILCQETLKGHSVVVSLGISHRTVLTTMWRMCWNWCGYQHVIRLEIRVFPILDI